MKITPVQKQALYPFANSSGGWAIVNTFFRCCFVAILLLVGSQQKAHAQTDNTTAIFKDKEGKVEMTYTKLSAPGVVTFTQLATNVMEMKKGNTLSFALSDQYDLRYCSWQSKQWVFHRIPVNRQNIFLHNDFNNR